MAVQPHTRNWNRLVRTLLGAQGERPFSVFVGSAMSGDLLDVLERQTLEHVGWEVDAVAAMTPEDRSERFREAWAQTGRQGQDTLFAAAADVVSQAEDEIRSLARLVAAGLFNIVVTTDATSTIENALTIAGLSYSDIDVMVAGVDSEAAMLARLAFDTPRVKIVKLRGSAMRHQYVFELAGPGRQRVIERVLGSRVLMVGHDLLRDQDVTGAVPASDEELFYVCASQPGAYTAIGAQLARRNTVYVVTEHASATFFTQLSRQLVGDQAGDVGLKDLAEAGIPVAGMSDLDFDQLSRAAADSRPLVELVNEPEMKPLLDTLRSGRSRTQAAAAPPAQTAADAGLPIVELPVRTIFRIQYDDRSERLSFTAAGAFQYASRDQHVRVDVDEVNSAMRILARDLATYLENGDDEGRNTWRERAKREGRLLWREMFAAYADLMEKFGTARFAARDEDLFLSFVGPRHHLGMPYELLYQEAPLAVQNAIYREVTGVAVRNPSVSELLSTLRRSRQPLRVLLVAGDSTGISSEEEVSELEAAIRDKTGALNIAVDIRILHSNDTSVEKLESLLGANGPHIVHYAGHSDFVATGEDSGLVLYDQRASRTGTRFFTARRLAGCLANSPTVLVYFSSCVGATVGSDALLRNYDYLGLMDAAVQAGIPVVFGYRWYVRDDSARRFASSFYDALLETQSPPVAVMKARQTVYREDGMDETWTSPILVAQRI